MTQLQRDSGVLEVLVEATQQAFQAHHGESTEPVDFRGSSEQVHKAFLRVDEKETEAAAATGAVVGERSAMRLPPRVHADRPYLFLIRERSTGAILFMGRVMNP